MIAAKRQDHNDGEIKKTNSRGTRKIRRSVILFGRLMSIMARYPDRNGGS
jgi:hypothetical protein